MTNREDIYNKALAMLKAGHSIQEILEAFPIAKSELVPLLELSQNLLNVPKGIVPTPLMQRKYAASKAKVFWLTWSHSFKFAALSSSLMLLLSAGAFTAYAARNSLPGNSLFAIKRAEENTQLIFTINPQAKANLEIALAQKRLDEAQQVFSNTSPNNQDAQTAALAELSSQTSSAVAAAAGVTQTDPQAQSNAPLLSSLENLTNQQQSLLKQIKSDTQIGAAAQTALVALNNNTQQLSQIKQAVSIADNSQALAQLNSTSTSVTALGKISAIGNGEITVEKITFTLDSQTEITNASGDKLQLSDLSPGDTVNVIGSPDQDSLLASKILITDNQTASATSTSTTIASTSTTTQAAISSSTSSTDKKVESAFTSKDQTDSTTADTTPLFNSVPNPNIASGGFIIEDPSPEFRP